MCQTPMLKLMLMLYLFVSLVCLVQAVDGDQCHPWSFYNDTLQTCQCYESKDLPAYYGESTYRDFMVKCTERKVLMNVVFCMTNEEEGTFIGDCRLYSFNQNPALVDGMYTELPENKSELNDYMCGPMNRKGRICSECIDGFAPSFTGFGYECANCTGVWYGIPLYLFLEFVPITLFYLAVLVLQISVTSSPLTYCVMYSQLVVVYLSLSPARFVLNSTTHATLRMVLMTFHGIFNLDFFRYILPPLCISPNLKFIHIIFLEYISALYPLCLVALTWFSIWMYSRNFIRPPVWLLNKLSRIKSNQNSKRTMVDIFATFFFLSYTKLYLISIMCFTYSRIFKENSTESQLVLYVDPSIVYLSKEHIPYAVVGVFVSLVFGWLPALLLAVYPVRILRSLFLIDCLSGRSKAALDIFVTKFYRCYRDGLDGGRDMRSFASLHLFIRLFIPIFLVFTYPTLFYGGCCILIFLVKPCKKAYMNNTDALILTFLALSSFQIAEMHINSTYSDFYQYSSFVTACIPLLITCANLIPQKCLINLKEVSTKFLNGKLSCCLRHKEIRVLDSDQHLAGDESCGCESDALLHESNSQLQPM